jgi:hypothetical protein
MAQDNKQEAIARVHDILTQHGIEMVVGGCGCCGSPWVEFTYNGETILDDEYVSINNKLKKG